MLVRSRVLKMLTTLIGTTQLFDVTVENIKLSRGMMPNAPIGVGLLGH